MAIFNAAEKAEQIRLWQAALASCAAGQEYTIGSRRLRRSDLPEIRKTLDWLNGQSTAEDEFAGRAAPHFAALRPGRDGRGGY